MPPVRRKPASRATPISTPSTPRSALAVNTPDIKIASAGDVILEVGPEKKRLHVSSHMMRASSNSFDVMFGPVFQEGQGLSVSSPKIVPLPEDDAEAMELACRIIHLHNDSLPERMDGDKTLTFARLVDKYDLHRTVHLAADRWLHITAGMSTTIEGLGKYLVSAELMDQERAYRRITKVLIEGTTASFRSIAMSSSDEDLWSRVFFLEERRAEIRTHLDRVLLVASTTRPYEPGGCQCGFDRSLVEKCETINKKLSYYNAADVTIAQVMKQFRSLPDPSATDLRMFSRCQKEHSTYKAYLVWMAEATAGMERRPASLCLPCTRTGNTTEHSETQPCPTKAVDDAEHIE